MPTEQQVIDTALGLINGALPEWVRAYEPSDVPSPRPNEHLVVTIVRRSGGSGRAGRYVTTGWSLYVLAASSHSGSNARVALEKARGVLESAVLTIDGLDSTPIEFGNGRAVAEDDGWYSGVDTYEFAL